MADIVVAGGGLAGLTAARHLAQQGHSVTLYERADTVGGRVRSSRVDGYVLDRGFQVLFTAYPAVQRELDLEALDLRRFTPGATIARPNHRSVLADPLRDPGSTIDTITNPDVRVADNVKLFRLQRELRSRDEAAIFDPERPDQSIREYLADRGFSRSFVDNFAAPFYGGITLDRSLGTDSRVFEYTLKMLSEGAIAVPAHGMGAITQQLAERADAAGATIRRGASVVAIDAGTESATVTVDGEDHVADGVVVATDPATARELTGVESIPTGTKGCVTQYVALPTRNALDTGRKLILNAESDQPNQIAPLSAVAPEYAPDGRQLLSATYLGWPEADDDTLFEQTRETLASWYPERAFDRLEHVGTERVEFAQFDQSPGSLASVPDPDVPAGPVVLAGDYTRWCSIHGALDSGRIAADILA